MAKKTIAKLKVYLETSFVSYLTGLATTDTKVAADQAWTRKWWEQERGKCDVYVSVYTLNEASRGRSELSEKRTALPRTQDILAKEGYRCPLIMTPETFLNNLNMEAKNV